VYKASDRDEMCVAYHLAVPSPSAMTTLSTDAAKLSPLAATDRLLISLALVREKLIDAKMGW
jgi:hypothetical protein